MLIPIRIPKLMPKPYEAQIAECHRLAASTPDPFEKAVYQAIAAELVAKAEAGQRH